MKINKVGIGIGKVALLPTSFAGAALALLFAGGAQNSPTRVAMIALSGTIAWSGITIAKQGIKEIYEGANET